MHAVKKYQVRKEARMEFRIEDAQREGESSVGRKWPKNKARSQASVEGSGWIVCKHAMNAEPRRQVSLGHDPKILSSR
jgi:hypothetical protein